MCDREEGMRGRGRRHEGRRKGGSEGHAHRYTDGQTDGQTRRRTDAEIVGKRGTGLEEMTVEADAAKHQS